MSFNKMKLSEPGSTLYQLKPAIKKMAVSSLVASILLIGGSKLTSAEETDLTTVYYVYINEEYIGTVSEKEGIENLVEQKVNQIKDTYRNVKGSLEAEVTFVPEQVFHSVIKTNNEKVMKVIEEQLAVKAEAYALIINGKIAAHVKDQQTAEKVLKQLKLQYVTESEIKEFEARKLKGNEPSPKLQENQNRLLDVRFAQKVSISKQKVAPKKLLTAEEALGLLTKGTFEETKYEVKQGDVLGSIASDHNMKLKQLLDLNTGLKEDSLLKVGQTLNVTHLEPLIQVIVEKEVMKKEDIPFQTKVIEDSSMFKGDTKIKQQGAEGVREVTYKVAEQNGKRMKQLPLSEKNIHEPIDQIVIKGTKEVPSRGEGSFAWPTAGGYVSSQMGYRWGKLHKGIDIARPDSRTIKAADNGIVISAGWDNGGYGNKIVIDHQNGYQTVYGHLESISVSTGQTVSKGAEIGIMGSTGDSTGVHLHFEIYYNGSLKNPSQYIR